MNLRLLLGQFPETPWQQVKYTMRGWAWNTAIAMLVMVVMAPFSAFLTSHGFESHPFPTDSSLTLKLVMAVIAAPFIEEMLFRSWLVSLDVQLLAGALCAALFAPMLLGWHNPIAVPIGFTGFFGLCVLYVASVLNNQDFGFKAPGRLQWAIGGVTTVLFGFAHLVNFSALPDNKLILVFLVLPQLASGTILLIARLQVGLWASMLLHGLGNAELLTVYAISEKLLPTYFVVPVVVLLVVRMVIVGRDIYQAIKAPAVKETV